MSAPRRSARCWPVAKRRKRDRVLEWAEARSLRVGSINPFVLGVRLVEQTVNDRVSGLAAEMAFWALLSLVPLLVTFGATMGYLEDLLGADTVLRGANAVIRGLAVIFSPRLTNQVLAPFLRALLTQERGGLALGGALVTLYLASRVFSATIRSLDTAYGVTERRGLVIQRLLSIGLAAGFIVVVVLTLLLMVVGPLLGTGQTLADRFGLGGLFQALWGIGRWPLLVGIVIAFLTCVYRLCPNVNFGWRACLPGAVLGVALWILASVGFRVYLAAGGGDSVLADTQDVAVALVGRVIGTLVATIVWTYLTGFAILVGGELNAELCREVR